MRVPFIQHDHMSPTGPADAPDTDGATSPAALSQEYRTLAVTEAAVNERLAGMTLDMPAMAAVSNVYRAAGAIRNHFEHTVLAPYNLTWTGWVVLRRASPRAP
jgi:hypothetical protein